MVDNTLKATSPLDGYTHTFDGTRVAEMDNLGIYSISVPHGGMDALNGQLNALCGLSFPETGRCVRASDIQLAGSNLRVALFGLQLDQCFLVAEPNSPGEASNRPGANSNSSTSDNSISDNSISDSSDKGMPDTCKLFEHIQDTLNSTAYLTNQSDSWAVLDINGELTLPALERLCMLDMDAVDTGSVARTVMEQLAIIIERTDTERVRLFSPRSSAGSFLHAVTTSLENVAGATSST